MITALQNKLDALKISGRVSNIKETDFFTCFYIDFLPDITLNKIRARRDDLELFFEGRTVEIDTDGGRVVLKVQKDTRPAVHTTNFLSTMAGGLDGFEIPLMIGEKEDGQKLFYDLVNMPHLLAGGSTGSGKSVFMHNCILSTLASSKSGIILIDIKRVEFSLYEGIPHLAANICYNSRQAAKTLRALYKVMMSRYETLQNSGARNIQEYRNRGGKMQYITVFIDELADLILSNRSIEDTLVRIAQLGRAAGIHLVLATQRPDASILSGLIRTNIPSRVCFAVQKATDSRIILDTSGGEKLRGAGDGLFMPIGSKTPVKFQAPYINTEDLEKLIEVARHVND